MQDDGKLRLRNERHPLPRLLGRFLAALSLLFAFLTMAPFRQAAENGTALLAILPALALALGILLAEQPAFFPLAVVSAQSIALRWSLTAAAVFTLAGTIIFLAMLGLYRMRDGRPKLAAFFARLQPLRSVLAAFCLIAAVVMTLYQTAGYFEVAAQGAGVPALLRSYRNLGFHPNWRAVLYSTIMMVVLITWPRKAKKLSRILPPAFIGICFVTALNLLLNPNPARTTVLEFGAMGGILFARLPVAALAMVLIYSAWDAFADSLRRRKAGRNAPA